MKSVCKNCKFYNVCGSNKRTIECNGYELKLDIQKFGGRGANSSSVIKKGNYTYTKNKSNLSIQVLDTSDGKILAKIAGYGPNGSFFDGTPREIGKNSPLAKGMKKKRG